ncbi:MAG TPA: Crp/Fnr family transcriptional regulator [Cytophagales bacterium]
MDQHAYLNQFYPLAEADYQRLTVRLNTKIFPKGTLLVQPGQVQRELYFVQSGVQMSFVEDGAGRQQVIAFTYPPGPCAIPGSFPGQLPSRYFLACLSDSRLDCLAYEALQELFDQSLPVERLFRRMTEALLAGVIDRHVELHTLGMEERYRAFCRRSPHLLQRVPHKYIASYLGIDPTNFSKLYNTVKF